MALDLHARLGLRCPLHGTKHAPEAPRPDAVDTSSFAVYWSSLAEVVVEAPTFGRQHFSRLLLPADDSSMDHELPEPPAPVPSHDSVPAEPAKRRVRYEAPKSNYGKRWLITAGIVIGVRMLVSMVGDQGDTPSAAASSGRIGTTKFAEEMSALDTWQAEVDHRHGRPTIRNGSRVTSEPSGASHGKHGRDYWRRRSSDR